ncbi:MAG: DUF1826 domain-containing protein [Paracoccaceae bacterium]
MTLLRMSVQEAAIGVAVTDEQQNLTAFLHPGCAAAIWRRQPTQDFQDWVNALDPSLLPQGRISVPRDAVRSAITDMCEASRTPLCHQRTQLIDDITNLANSFSELMKASYLRLRLQVITSNACRRFHVDAITARLVCTYRGTGTQYGISTDGNEPVRVFTVPTHAPILLRGTQWPETPCTGLLHRSPPIEGTGETRFVVVIDPISDLEDTV